MDKESYYRITEILRPFSGIEFVPEYILKPACDRGTKVHECIENILKGGFPNFSEEDEGLMPYIKSFEKFWSTGAHAFKRGEIKLEERLFCNNNVITGKPDVIAKTEGRTYLIDWKTSSSPQKSWALQGAAYRYLCEVSGYENVDSVLFVKLDKEGKKPTLYKHDDYEENISIFFKCLELYKWFDMKNRRDMW